MTRQRRTMQTASSTFLIPAPPVEVVPALDVLNGSRCIPPEDPAVQTLPATSRLAYILKTAWTGCVLAALCAGGGMAAAQTVAITPAQAEKIGRQLWRNEAGGTVSG